jgi:hypothetical protein
MYSVRLDAICGPSLDCPKRATRGVASSYEGVAVGTSWFVTSPEWVTAAMPARARPAGSSNRDRTRRTRTSETAGARA